MNAIELELRERISLLEEKVEELQAQQEEYNFNERIRQILASYGLIDRAAEDE